MHAFGLTNWKAIRRLPFYSYDSTTWVSSARYGRIPVFDEHKVNMTSVSIGRNLEWKKWANWLYYLTKYGYDWQKVLGPVSDGKLMAEIGALSYMVGERWLQNHHDVIDGIRGLLPGPKIYLANSNLTYLDGIIRAARKVQSM